MSCTPIDTKTLKAFLSRATNAGAREIFRNRIGVDLRRQHEAFGQTAALTNNMPDAPLGAAVAVAVRCIHKVEPTVEYGANGGVGLLVVDCVTVETGHARQRARADADRRNRQARTAEQPRRRQTFHLHRPLPHGRAISRSRCGKQQPKRSSSYLKPRSGVPYAWRPPASRPLRQRGRTHAQRRAQIVRRRRDRQKRRRGTTTPERAGPVVALSSRCPRAAPPTDRRQVSGRRRHRPG